MLIRHVIFKDVLLEQHITSYHACFAFLLMLGLCITIIRTVHGFHVRHALPYHTSITTIPHASRYLVPHTTSINTPHVPIQPIMPKMHDDSSTVQRTAGNDDELERTNVL